MNEIPTRRLQSLLTPRGTAQEQAVATRELDRLLDRHQLAVCEVKGPEDLVRFTSVLVRELYDVEPITTEAPEWSVYLVGKPGEVKDAARAHRALQEDFARVWALWCAHVEETAAGAVPTTRYRHLFYFSLTKALYARIAHFRRRQGQRVRPPAKETAREGADSFSALSHPASSRPQEESRVAAHRGAERVAGLVGLGGALLRPRPLPRALPAWEPGRFALLEVGEVDSARVAPRPERTDGGRFAMLEAD